MENLTQRIRAELTAPGTPDEIAERISRLLAPDFQRHEKGVRYAIKVAMERERCVFHLAGLIRAGEADRSLVKHLAHEALLKMGYSEVAIDRLLEMGEPVASLV